MFGFDNVPYVRVSTRADADLNFHLLQPTDITAIRDRFLQLQALCGGAGEDILRGLGVRS